MGGGLPGPSQLGKKIGMGRDVLAFSKYAGSAEWLGGQMLSDLFAPPDPIEFPEVKPATPPPTISEVQEAGERWNCPGRRVLGTQVIQHKGRSNAVAVEDLGERVVVYRHVPVVQ